MNLKIISEIKLQSHLGKVMQISKGRQGSARCLKWLVFFNTSCKLKVFLISVNTW